MLDEVNYQLNYMSYLYSMLGYSYDPTDPTIIAQTKDDVMDMLVEDAVETLKAQELGLNEFTEEELAEIAESVDNDWESNKSSLQSQEFADTDSPVTSWTLPWKPAWPKWAIPVNSWKQAISTPRCWTSSVRRPSRTWW